MTPLESFWALDDEGLELLFGLRYWDPDCVFLPNNVESRDLTSFSISERTNLTIETLETFSLYSSMSVKDPLTKKYDGFFGSLCPFSKGMFLILILPILTIPWSDFDASSIYFSSAAQFWQLSS